MALTSLLAHVIPALSRYSRKTAVLVVSCLGMVMGPASASQELVLAMSNASVNLPIFIADHEGYFTAQGLTVRIEEVPSSVHGMDILAQGKADLTTGSEVLVMFSSFKSSDFAVLATFGSSTEDMKVIAHGKSGINNPSQLANKRVGTILGSSSHYYIDTLALLNGVDPNSITLVGYQPGTIVAALAQHEVDAISIWQPLAYSAAEEIVGARTLPDAGFYTQRYNLIASRAVIGAREDELIRLMRALDRAIQFIDNEPAKVRAIMAARLLVDTDNADWFLQRYRFRLALEQSLLTTLESEARWAREEGHVQAAQSPNYLTFIHAEPLTRVRPTAVGIVR